MGDTDPLKLKRSRCAAGHKAMWHESFDGLPDEDFLVKLDPLLGGLKERLFSDTYTCDVKVGTLSEEWAEKLGSDHRGQCWVPVPLMPTWGPWEQK